MLEAWREGLGLTESSSDLCPGLLTGVLGPGTALSTGWGQQRATAVPGRPRRARLLETVFVTSLPGLPAKDPPASGAARQVQLRILTTAAFVPRISIRLGRPQSVLPVPQRPPLLGQGAWGLGTPAPLQSV